MPTQPAGHLPQFMPQPGPRFCVLPAPDLPRVFLALPPDWHLARKAGFNVANGRTVDLCILVNPD